MTSLLAFLRRCDPAPVGWLFSGGFLTATLDFLPSWRALLYAVLALAPFATSALPDSYRAALVGTSPPPPPLPPLPASWPAEVQGVHTAAAARARLVVETVFRLGFLAIGFLLELALASHLPLWTLAPDLALLALFLPALILLRRSTTRLTTRRLLSDVSALPASTLSHPTFSSLAQRYLSENLSGPTLDTARSLAPEFDASLADLVLLARSLHPHAPDSPTPDSSGKAS